MGADAWAELLTHVRAVLNDLDDQVLGPRLIRLRASPASRLAGGRLRQQLARSIAEDGPVWDALRARLEAQADPHGPLGFLLTGRAPEPPVEPAGAPAPAPDRADGVDVGALRDRIRELVGQRDDARRGRTGAEARADTAEAKLDERDARIAELERHVERLEAEQDEAEQEHRRAVDRLQRQHAAQISALRDEVRELRRTEEERRAEERRRQEARRRRHESERQARAVGEAPSVASESPVRAGRPTRLPPGAEPGSAAYAEALLTPGRTMLVDGYNVSLRHRPQLQLAEQRAWLVKLLESVVARFGVDAEVVFDTKEGVPGRTVTSRSVRVRFTEPGVSADDDIVFAVAAAPEDLPILVVTDDRELAERVRAYRADVVGGAPFLWAVE